jgi:Domain of unknown function (DUF4190)
MSQYPPGVPPGYPPPNFPPGMPPGMGQGYSIPGSSRTSGAAITSLVCGILGCIPLVTGVVAVITGIVGISATSNPAVKGRGMAIAGLILGLISIGLWLAFGGGLAAALHGAKPERDFAKAYITDLSGGNVDKCVANSTSNVTKDQLAADAKQMQAWGPLVDTLIFGFNINNQNGQIAGSVSGVCTFANGKHQFLMMISKDSSGQLKADSFLWQN